MTNEQKAAIKSNAAALDRIEKIKKERDAAFYENNQLTAKLTQVTAERDEIVLKLNNPRVTLRSCTFCENKHNSSEREPCKSCYQYPRLPNFKWRGLTEQTGQGDKP